MKVKLLRKIRKNWVIYENKRYDSDRSLYRFYAYRKGKLITWENNLYSLKQYVFEIEIIKNMFLDHSKWVERKRERKFRNRLVKVWP